MWNLARANAQGSESLGRMAITVPGMLAVLITHGTWTSVARAQTRSDTPDDRTGMTGRELFEHHWKPLPPDAESAKRNRINLRGDGLGPLHNATSCAECHVAGGGSGVQHNVTLITIDPRSPLVRRDDAESGRVLLHVFPGLLGPKGQMTFSTVVHDRSTRDGYASIRSRLADFVPDGMSAAWFTPKSRTSAAIAERPVVAGRHETVDFFLSQRNSPALFGLGVIDSISVERLEDLALRQASESDGKITGRVAGKFGWKGQLHSVSSFVRQACAGELGLTQTTNLITRTRSGAMAKVPQRTTVPLTVAAQAGDPADLTYLSLGSDMEADEVQALIRFVSRLPRPVERLEDHHSFDEVLRGEAVFKSVGCSDCHLPDLHPVSGMFSDLLLHDMGSGLQSPIPAPHQMRTENTQVTAPKFPVKGPQSLAGSPGFYAASLSRDSRIAPSVPRPTDAERPEKPSFITGEEEVNEHGTQSQPPHRLSTLQREWRTPPLWGIADTAPYLHDGRAETLEEAILWHGGEALDSRRAFSELKRSDKDLMLMFLSTLRAPELPESEDSSGEG